MYIANSRTTLYRLSSPTFSKRFITTKKPLFSGANRHARDLEVGQIPSPAAASTSASASASTSTAANNALKDPLEKARNDLLNKLGSNSSGTVVASAGPSSSSSITAAAQAAAANNSALPHGKVFTVRPITSWIDKLANQHGAPTGTHINPTGSPTEPPKKYQKRDLLLRTMQDSYTEIILPFKTDKALLEEYINVGGSLRHGKIMEDLDALAGAISYKHTDDGKPDSSPLAIVTASVDRIDLLKPLGVCDLRLSGHVTYVGYSSMEIYMKMEEINKDKPGQHGDTILVARFTMVARDALTGKAAQVNPLLLRDDNEKKLFQMGEDHKTKKRVATDSALTKLPPTQEERFLIHDLYLEYSKYDDPQNKTNKPDDVEWMADTKMSAVHIMQPQDRNIHDKIFGGYLMRLAYELAFCNASSFIASRPTFLALDEISFRKPVPIGTFLALDSQIVYAEGGDHHSFQVMVKADVLDVKKGTRETTNTFWFTFTDPVKGTNRIMPKTYAESMLYLEGKRRRMLGSQLAGINRKSLGLQK
ncbi:MAG: acyl-CoA hydrolase [Linnemannia elongata]|nr:MAG: acyl-CoA hydrolase [Linnemannia elongata]